jgi:hypothetical protein
MDTKALQNGAQESALQFPRVAFAWDDPFDLDGQLSEEERQGGGM